LRGQWFLNYNCELIPTDDGGDPCYADLIRYKGILEQRLNQFRNRPSIWSKYKCVARYHDSFCERYSVYFSRKYMINEDLVRLSPCLIDFPDQQDLSLSSSGDTPVYG
jgi:hypothetical protein